MDTKTEDFLVALAVLVSKHGASLFFGDAKVGLWIDGEDKGYIADTENSCGDRFEIRGWLD